MTLSSDVTLQEPQTPSEALPDATESKRDQTTNRIIPMNDFRHDTEQIKQGLATRADEVAKLLYPNGRRQGNDWVVGNADGDPGQSFKICINGSKVGIWTDFAGGGGGKNLLELWRLRHNLDFTSACREARKFLGMVEPLPEGSRGAVSKRLQKQGPKSSPSERKPIERTWCPLNAEGPVFRYLAEKRRIDPKVLDQYAVRQTSDSATIVFLTVDQADGVPVMAKYLPLDRPKGKKAIWTSKDPTKALWGKETISEECNTLTITEGEIDALTLAGYHIPAVSVPFGAKAETGEGRNPNDEWIEEDFDWLERFERIILAFDSDELGQQAAVGLATRLGRERCFLATPPDGTKDWNEAHVRGLGSKIEQAWHQAKPCDPPEFRNSSEFIDDLINEIHPQDEQASGYDNPLIPQLRIRPHEVTVWTGTSGHGKSLLLLQLMLQLADQGARACIASLEIPTKKSYAFMVRQACGAAKPDKIAIRRFSEWTGTWLWSYDHVGDRNLGSILETFSYAYKRYGIDQFVVDSLVKLGIAHDDYDGQKRAVESLCDFVQEFPVHVHLVAHSRKGSDEVKRPGKLDVAGHADITNLAHNGVTVWRNKPKEQAVQAHLADRKCIPTEVASQPDTVVDIWKQRETGEEPSVQLAFNLASKSFHPLFEGRRANLTLASFCQSAWSTNP